MKANFVEDDHDGWCVDCGLSRPCHCDSELDCGLMPDGQCLLAGTEHCDWDCGRLNRTRIAAMKLIEQATP